jgi:hypothetical protein
MMSSSRWNIYTSTIIVEQLTFFAGRRQRRESFSRVLEGRSGPFPSLMAVQLGKPWSGGAALRGEARLQGRRWRLALVWAGPNGLKRARLCSG